jgi:isopentenyl-diphosphate delta-isomerase
VLVFNKEGQMLLQQRAFNKYHSGGLWTNACCSHQRIDEKLDEAVHKRLMEEMGIDCELKEVFTFRYYATFANGLRENEIDHVFVGQTSETPVLNKEEAEDYKWISLEDLQKEISEYPQNFTIWFKIKLVLFLTAFMVEMSNGMYQRNETIPEAATHRTPKNKRVSSSLHERID